MMTKAKLVVAIITAGLLGGGSLAVAQSPSPYAAEVIEYVQGTGVPTDYLPWLPGECGQTSPCGKFNDPWTALGPPTVDTTGDAFGTGDPLARFVPVVPANSPFRFFEIVSIGQGGSLILKFDHPVQNDRKNPCGLDFTIFGNAFHIVPGGASWVNQDPNAITVTEDVAYEQGRVSVSQDGVTWFSFEDGPYADDFAPTLGRVYDPSNPDLSLGAWNAWWGFPTDPTRPLRPCFIPFSFAGLTVAQVSQLYGESAGGTSFEIGQLGLDWIQYVRIENPAGSGITTEIDALADVAPTACPADFDCDDHVAQNDLDHFHACRTGPALGPPLPGCHDADLDGDSDVDQDDFGVWQRCHTGLLIYAEPNCMD